MYKGLKGDACIPTDDHIPTLPLPPPIRHSRNHHSLTFQTPTKELTFTKAHYSLKQSEIGMPFQICSFFPQTIRDWNALPDSIITSAEGAEHGVARFTSLVRARD